MKAEELNWAKMPTSSNVSVVWLPRLHRVASTTSAKPSPTNDACSPSVSGPVHHPNTRLSTSRLPYSVSCSGAWASNARRVAWETSLHHPLASEQSSEGLAPNIIAHMPLSMRRSFRRFIHEVGYSQQKFQSKTSIATSRTFYLLSISAARCSRVFPFNAQ